MNPNAFVKSGVPLDPANGKWPIVRLADLAKGGDAFADGPFGSHLKTEHYRESGARVIRLQNIGRGEFLDTNKAFISLDHFNKLHRHSVREGDVVVAALGDGARPAGRACLVPTGFGNGIVKADCFRIRPPVDVIDADYLILFFNSPVSLTHFAAQMRGATRPRLTLGMLRDMRLPLPPLPEQQRIAARLRGQLAAAEIARHAAKAYLGSIEKLPAALLREAFGGEEEIA